MGERYTSGVRRRGCVAGWKLCLAGFSVGLGTLLVVPSAGAAEDPYTLLDAIPAPPSDLAAAARTTQVGSDSDAALTAPAYDALKTRIAAAAVQSAGSAGGVDFARASTDPAYAAQVQARMANMSTADKMAFAQQVMAAQRQGTSAADSSALGTFLASQRGADTVATNKIRALLDGALKATAAKHKSVEDSLNAMAKACPQDSTGWPLSSCTTPLGSKSLAQHRAVEEAALATEDQAFGQARSIAGAELAKARDLLTRLQGSSSATPVLAWAMTYVQLLDDYGRTMTLHAGFWAHANAGKYTGSVTNYIHTPDGKDIDQ
jgi:hypothetical protein